VNGELPEMLHWVREYGATGATLIEQPPAVFDHPHANAVALSAGGWHVVVPLFTTDELPSDLSAELVVGPTGEARITGVHVL
jgi:hypothetical protein